MLGEGWDLHGDGYRNMGIYVDVARGAVMQVFFFMHVGREWVWWLEREKVVGTIMDE